MMRAHQLELAAEYLLMAAVLIEIKSRMLLPRPVMVSDDEAADPRAELVRRLLEYEQMKLASIRINELPQALRDFALVEVWIEETAVKRLPHVDPGDLRGAWLGLVSRARLLRHHRVSREELSVREHMTRILKRLSGQEYVEFSDLFNPAAGVTELVVTFLALLELARETLVEVTQQDVFGAIYVRSTHFLTVA